MRAAAVSGDERRRRGADGGAHAAGDGRRGTRRAASRRTSRTPSPPRGRCASRSSTTAASARSCAGSRPRALRSTCSRTTSTPTRLRRTTASLLSPGPGDPAPLVAEAQTVADLLGRTPVLGVCLGHQLLALATGHETFKLPFGHRGANHPVLDHRSNQVLVTSQNHGFAVAAGDDTPVTHTSLYDGTVEGLVVPGWSALALRSSTPKPRRGRTMPRRSSPAGSTS